MRDSGTYALVITLPTELSLQIGKLGVYNFQPGYYVYAGSALNGLSNRLKRHSRSDKKLHWHIDYLLQKANLTQIWYAMGPDRLECRWNMIIQNLPGATTSIPGFGSSDCHCSSHLTHFRTILPPQSFQTRLGARQMTTSALDN